MVKMSDYGETGAKNLRQVTRDKIEQYVKEGWVTSSRHRSLPLTIYNYTKKTQFAHKWDTITKMCRGLVLDDDNRIVINAPEKFFNQGEPEAPTLDLTNCKVLEKLDGYYIAIRYDKKYGLLVTSRGSFDSKYAEKAREILKEQEIHFSLDTDYFCELLCDFPEDSSIIVTKHPEQTLVLWGVDNDIPYDGCGWDGEMAMEIPQDSLSDYLHTEVEGVVLFDPATKERLKVKTDWYITMHRAISGCSKNRVWEILQGGGKLKGQTSTTYTGVDKKEYTLDLAQIPEEHFQTMLGWEDELQKQFDYYIGTAHFYEDLYKTWSDKEFATNPLVPLTYRRIVLAWRHKKDPTKQVWRSVKNKLLRNPEN